jgi:uncharacterized membrane protein
MSGTISIFAVKLLISVGLFFFAGMIGLISYALYNRQIPKNVVMGIRFPQAFYSDQNWYEINAYGGKVLLIWAVSVIVVGILVFVVPISNDTLLYAIYFSLYASLIIPIMIMAVYADRFKPQQRDIPDNEK